MGRSDWHRRRVLAAITAVAFVYSAGCSLLVGSSEKVFISATDPEAMIYVDGNFVGRGRVFAELVRNRDHAVLAKAGDRTGVAYVGTRISDAGVADIVGCALILIPCVGLGGHGFRSLTPSNVLVVVPPSGSIATSQESMLGLKPPEAKRNGAPGMLGAQPAPSTPRRGYWELPH